MRQKAKAILRPLTDKPTGNSGMYPRNEAEIDSHNVAGGRSSLSESYPANRVDYIVRSGLGDDPRAINYYRRVIQDPERMINEQNLRRYGAEVLENLLDILFEDDQVWNRVKSILSKRKNRFSTRSLREDVSEEGAGALIRKAEKHEIPLEVIFEVYSRGAEGASEEDGFSRVNSFIAGGRARKLDADLLENVTVKTDRVKKDTLNVVKRVLSERKELR